MDNKGFIQPLLPGKTRNLSLKPPIPTPYCLLSAGFHPGLSLWALKLITGFPKSF